MEAEQQQTEEEQQHPTPESLKERGNEAVKSQKFAEAILYYTHAIKLDPNNFTLHSNRSFAFLKVHQYYLAMEDANETVRLNPAWPKGYFRKAEIEFATHNYTEAILSYQKALLLKPNDINLIDALKRTKLEIDREKRADDKIPWLGAGIGIIVGVAIVIADCVFTHKPTHPILMACVTIIIALVGYGIAKTYRYYVKSGRAGLLEPPLGGLIGNKGDDDDEENSTEKETEKEKPHARYTKSQARQRYRKAKRD